LPVDCRVREALPLPSQALVDRLRALSTSLVSDVFGRWAGAPGLGAVAGLADRQVVVGPAMTVRTRPGDNLVVHKALDLIRPGEVLVVAAGGATDRAILGGLMGQYAATKGVAALIVDGAVRDVSDLSRLAPPVFAAGISHLGPYKDGPGDIRGPVSLAGLAVEDGDLVIADEDGVAIIPRARFESILSQAEDKQRAEQFESDAIGRGVWDRSWIDRALNVIEVPVSAPLTDAGGNANTDS
jgi:regulator of RNase E activity RraA